MDSIFATPTSEKTERELILEMHEKLEALERREKRRSVMSWTAAIIAVIVIAAVLMLIVPRYQAIKAQYDAVAETVQEMNTVLENIDIEGLTGAAEFLSSINYEKLQELAGVLETVDTGNLSEQLTEITDLIDQLGELNTEGLVNNINLIIEKLQPVMNWLGR